MPRKPKPQPCVIQRRYPPEGAWVTLGFSYDNLAAAMVEIDHTDEEGEFQIVAPLSPIIRRSKAVVWTSEAVEGQDQPAAPPKPAKLLDWHRRLNDGNSLYTAGSRNGESYAINGRGSEWILMGHQSLVAQPMPFTHLSDAKAAAEAREAQIRAGMAEK